MQSVFKRRIIYRRRAIRHAGIKMFEHLLMRIVIAFAVPSRKVGKSCGGRIKKRCVFDDDLVWFVPVPYPECVRLFLVPRHAGLGPENLESEVVLATRGHLVHRE